MDLKSFSENDFNPKDWINEAWQMSSNQHDKELFASATVTKLQLYMKQLTNGLDETTVQIVRGVPRILQEAEVLTRDGAALREHLLSLERRAGDVEADTGHSIDSLRRIDKLKSSLQVACVALREADKWAQLATALEEKLAAGAPKRGELEEITQQVAAMTTSLEVLSEAPDYESKRVQLEVLYNRLEAALSPAIVEALTQKNAENATAYGATLSAMGRSTACVRYWRRVEAARLEAAWRRRHDAGVARELPRDLHADLLAHAHSQLDWLSEVIRSPTPLTELVRLYTEVLAGLEPAPGSLARAALRHCATAADALNLLVDLRATMTHFMKSVAAILENGKAEKVPESAVHQLSLAVHAPLREILPSYTELQTKALTDLLAAVDCRQEDPLDRARSLQTCVERSDAWVKQAHATGRKVAGAACYPHLLPALEALFAELCSRLSSNLRLLDASLAEQDTWNIWNLLPAALALATAAGTLREHVKQAETQVGAHLADSESEDTDSLVLLDEGSLEELSRLRSARGRDAALAGTAEDVGRVCRSLASAVLRILCETPARQLDKMAELAVWRDNDSLAADLPDFSIAPQEYITQVGQYLMTLPQHLEPSLAQRPAGLAACLSATDKDLAVYLLNEVCAQTCEMYSDKVFSVRNMDALGAKRCATDIAYLCSVVEELGGSVPPSLRTLEKSLRAARNTQD